MTADRALVTTDPNRDSHGAVCDLNRDSHGADVAEAVPYFAMEYIPNAKPISQYAKEKKLGTRERLDLFGKVCDAVHHGHQKGIIHRDPATFWSTLTACRPA